ncbi:YbjN domain-containing protein [Kribbia dieselivorans]|uniref:YbjN domain-containing protein n=1 Tax=Kribbia dieselivorans TaxID=331526 RepID=UPI0008389D9C|nr:YbjN domain-containing protein [Kribbia dieselivorans]
MTDPTALPNFVGGPPTAAQPEEEQNVPLVDIVRDSLLALGSEPRIDNDGDVEFEYEGQRLYVRCTEEPMPALRVFGQWMIDESAPADAEARLRICADVNAAYYLIKTAVVGENSDLLLVACESLLVGGTDVREILSMAVPLTMHGVQVWHEQATALGGGSTLTDQNPQEQA